MWRWGPDNCGCDLLFEHGDVLPPTLLVRCPVHQQATGLDIWDESRSVQSAKGILLLRLGIQPDVVTHRFGASNGRQRHLTVDVPQDLPAVVAQEIAASLYGPVTTLRRV